MLRPTGLWVDRDASTDRPESRNGDRARASGSRGYACPVSSFASDRFDRVGVAPPQGDPSGITTARRYPCGLAVTDDGKQRITGNPARSKMANLAHATRVFPIGYWAILGDALVAVPAIRPDGSLD